MPVIVTLFLKDIKSGKFGRSAVEPGLTQKRAFAFNAQNEWELYKQDLQA